MVVPVYFHLCPSLGAPTFSNRVMCPPQFEMAGDATAHKPTESGK